MKIKVEESVLADANPTDERLARFQRLAKLNPSRIAAFKQWAEGREFTEQQMEVARDAWNAAWESMKTGDMFSALRTTAIFDESFRLPQLKAGSDEFRGNVEQKFAALMQRISLLVLTIQRDYEKSHGYEEEKDNACLQ